MMSFQWFYQWICISLRALGLFCHVVWLGTGQFRWTIGTIGTTTKTCHSNGSTGEYAEKREFIHVMFNKHVGVFYQGIKPRGEAEWVIMKFSCFVCVRKSIKLIDCIPSPTGKQYYTVLLFFWYVSSGCHARHPSWYACQVCTQPLAGWDHSWLIHHCP